jgi:hypothetical protein
MADGRPGPAARVPLPLVSGGGGTLAITLRDGLMAGTGPAKPRTPAGVQTSKDVQAFARLRGAGAHCAGDTGWQRGTALTAAGQPVTVTLTAG